MEIWNKYSNILFTDGACDNIITKKGGWSYIILYQKGQIEIQECSFEINTTNNRMELVAVIESLQKIKELDLQGKTLVLSDSLLSINCASRIWKRKKNLDLWNKLDEVNFGIQAQFTWIKGHSGLEYNEKCDDLAEVSCNLQQSYSNIIHRSESLPLKELSRYVN